MIQLYIKRQYRSISNSNCNFKKEDNKKQGVLQFYSTRKKKSRISDEYKAKLVIDAKMNSLTMTEICRKYFI